MLWTEHVHLYFQPLPTCFAKNLSTGASLILITFVSFNSVSNIYLAEICALHLVVIDTVFKPCGGDIDVLIEAQFLYLLRITSRPLYTPAQNGPT